MLFGMLWGVVDRGPNIYVSSAGLGDALGLMMVGNMFARVFPPLVLAFVLVIWAGVAFPKPLGAQTVEPVKIIAFGDSLTAGYLLQPSQSFAAQLQMALDGKGYKTQVINAGVSGDTTSGGLERLSWTLEQGADAVILELGANDALRGIDPAIASENLDKMLTILKAKGLEVVLAGMRAPGNWGPEYVAQFDAIYPELARKHDVTLYPFFLEGVAKLDASGAFDPKLVLSDGLHPTAEGVGEIVKRILPDVEAMIGRVQARKAAAR